MLCPINYEKYKHTHGNRSADKRTELLFDINLPIRTKFCHFYTWAEHLWNKLPSLLTAFWERVLRPESPPTGMKWASAAFDPCLGHRPVSKRKTPTMTSSGNIVCCKICQYPGYDLRVLGCGCTLHAVSWTREKVAQEKEGSFGEQTKNPTWLQCWLKVFSDEGRWLRSFQDDIVLLNFAVLMLVISLLFCDSEVRTFASCIGLAVTRSAWLRGTSRPE